MNREFFHKIWFWSRFLVTAFAALAIFNYPRTWWQELICATLLLWSGVFLAALCVDIIRFRKISWTVSRAILVLLQALCVFRAGQIVMPYLYATKKASPQIAYSEPARFLFIDISERVGNDRTNALKALVDREDPSMIVLTRFADTPVLEGVAERFPSRYISPSSHGRVIELFSKLTPRGPTRVELGYAALPGVVGEFLTGDGHPVIVGAVDLLPPHSQEDFLRSRLTSRRLASSLKYARTPRIVLGAFRTSLTSQIVDMYREQLRLRALSFDSGISIFPRLVWQSMSFTNASHVFTARHIEVSRVAEFRDDDRGFSAVVFDAKIPRETLSPLERPSYGSNN